MPVMAEVDFFTTMNGSLNTSLQEDDQYCDKGSSPVRNENSGVVASDLDGKLDNGERNSAGNKSLSTQDGDVPQNMEQTLDSVAVDMKQTSSEVSFDMPSDLGNNEDSKTQCSSSENLECNGQTLILPNASSLAQTKTVLLKFCKFLQNTFQLINYQMRPKAMNTNLVFLYPLMHHW